MAAATIFSKSKKADGGSRLGSRLRFQPEKAQFSLTALPNAQFQSGLRVTS